MINGLKACITDFGTAKIYEKALSSATLSVLGTPVYLSPLLFKAWKDGGMVCHHKAELSEIFSLGLTLLQAALLLTGEEMKDLNDEG